MSEPRKHHFIPQFLLRGFGDERGRLMVHPLLATKPYLSTVRDVGHQNDGHTLYRRNGTIDRRSLEGAMSAIEVEAATTIREIVDGAELNRERQWNMAWFLALQWHRSRYLLDSVAAEVARGDLTPEELQTGILRVVMFPFFSAWHNRNDTTVRYKDRWDAVVEETMGSFVWTVRRFRHDSLVLGDQTVCLWGVRPGGMPTVNHAWARHGIGIGWGDVGRVSVPLTPGLGLLLTRPGAEIRLSAPAFNRATVYNARRFVVHTPNWGHDSAGLVQAFNDAMGRQRMLAPVFYRNQF